MPRSLVPRFLKGFLKLFIPNSLLARYRMRRWRIANFIGRTSSQERMRLLIARSQGQWINVDPVDLVTPSRFDIPAKILYARHRLKNVKSAWAANIYAEHIRVWNGYHEIAPEKRGLQEFLDNFDTVLLSIRERGFDSELSVIPIGSSGSPINGAHRIAASILHKRKVICQSDPANLPSHNYNYHFFKNRTVHGEISAETCDAIALEYCRVKPDTRIVLVFPSAHGKHQTIKSILSEHGSLVYEKELLLSDDGAVNLIRTLYEGELWLGSRQDGYSGARRKAKLCFPTTGLTRLFVIETISARETSKAKRRIRNLFQLGNHSVHINDEHRGTVRIAMAVLTPNGKHFLEHRRLASFARLEMLIDRVTNWIKDNAIDPEDICVSGSAVLSAYGLRECQDVDLVHRDLSDFPAFPNQVGSHNGYMRLYPVEKDEIIYNPQNHFYYRGLKFASAALVRAMKAARGEPKDIRDVQLLDLVLGSPHPSPVSQPTGSGGPCA